MNIPNLESIWWIIDEEKSDMYSLSDGEFDLYNMVEWEDDDTVRSRLSEHLIQSKIEIIGTTLQLSSGGGGGGGGACSDNRGCFVLKIYTP